jgi:hypothetical protein
MQPKRLPSRTENLESTPRCTVANTALVIWVINHVVFLVNRALSRWTSTVSVVRLFCRA